MLAENAWPVLLVFLVEVDCYGLSSHRTSAPFLLAAYLQGLKTHIRRACQTHWELRKGFLQPPPQPIERKRSGGHSHMKHVKVRRSNRKMVLECKEASVFRIRHEAHERKVAEIVEKRFETPFFTCTVAAVAAPNSHIPDSDYCVSIRCVHWMVLPLFDHAIFSPTYRRPSFDR
jgi:hypothetical protein